MAIPRRPMTRSRVAAVNAVLVIFTATLYACGRLPPSSSEGHSTWFRAVSGTWFGAKGAADTRTGSKLHASLYSNEESRERSTGSKVGSLAGSGLSVSKQTGQQDKRRLSDIVLILNYNHPTDAFKSLGFWLRVYRRLFLDVVVVSTEAIPELGIESAVSVVCNTTLVQCVRDKLSGAPLPLPRGMPSLQGLHSGLAETGASEERRTEVDGGDEGGNEAPLPPPPQCEGPGCTCSESERGFWSAVGECRGVQEKRLRDLGPVCGSSAYFVYAGLLSILPRYPTAAGFLWTNDDLILNWWNLEQCNKSRLWLPHPASDARKEELVDAMQVREGRPKRGRRHWKQLMPLWVVVPQGMARGRRPRRKVVGRWEFKRASISRAVRALELLPAAYRRQFEASMLPRKSVVLKEVADVYYIPQLHVPAVLQAVPHFLTARVRSEMAIPMLFCSLEHPNDFDAMALQDIVYIPPQRVLAQARALEARFDYWQNLSAYHPWKMKQPSEASKILEAISVGDPSLREGPSMRMFYDRKSRCFF